MFEDIKILGGPPRSLKMQTRKGTDIPNEVAPAPQARHYRIFQDLLGDFDRWEVRCDPVGIYNCAGHVWASRRTSIYDPKVYRLILDDDGYRIINQTDVRPGDIAVYLDEEKTEIYHVGMVVMLRDLLVGSSLKEPWILSKLNDSLGEILHAASDFRLPSHSLVPEFWTDRPLESRGLVQ